jgi:hypothetical protein
MRTQQDDKFLKEMIEKISYHQFAYEHIFRPREPFRMSKAENDRIHHILTDYQYANKEIDIPSIGYFCGCKIELI